MSEVIARRRRMAGTRVGLVALALLALLPGTASAQSTGSIAGLVSDASGGVLPGVTVEAASPALIEGTRVGVSDGQGRYRIIDLRPGVYTVTFTLSGFSTFVREGIELNAGFTAAVNVELAVGALEETVTVSGAGPVVDVQSVRTQNVLTREVLDTVPTARTYSSFIALTLGADVTSLGAGDIGGSQGETVTQMAHHGTGDGLTTVDGMKTSSAYNVASAHRNIFNQMMVEEIVIETSGATAEAEGGGLNVNMIPKSGGNTFSGSFVAEYTNERFNSDNLNSDLEARGLENPNSIDRIYDYGFGLGGPIVEDRFWFYTAHRKWGSKELIGGLFFNKNQNNFFPGTFVSLYEPDLTRQAFKDKYVQDHALRLTWQAAPNHKFAFTGNMQDYCWCYSFINSFSAPEATWDFQVFPNNNFQATWTYAASSRVLVEAGASLRVDRQKNGAPPETGNAISIVDQGLGNIMYGSTFANFNADTNYGDFGNQGAWQSRASVSYITGSHAIKVGYYAMTGKNQQVFLQPIHNEQYRFRSGVPNQITQLATPHSQFQNLDIDLGIYAQDTWTVHRLTLNLGARFDHLRGSVPAQTRLAGKYTPAFSFDAVDDVPNFKDISPRLGAAYDLFGDGKTAVKASLGRYVNYISTQVTKNNNPASRIAGRASRTWSDANGDYIPDCDLTLTTANGECGALDNQLFGSLIPTVDSADDVLRGWYNRPYNWQFNVALQQELGPGVALEFIYFRTWFGNQTVTDDLNLGPEDFDQYSYTVPSNDLLPGGGGNVLTGLFDVKPGKFLQQGIDTLIVHADGFTDVYNGVQLSINARFGDGGILQGGVSTGQTTTNECNHPDTPGAEFCETTVPWAAATQVKFTGSYPLPYGFQASATLQNLPGRCVSGGFFACGFGPAIGIDLFFNTTLGRLPSDGNPIVVINLAAPETIREDRYTVLDIRLSKRLQVGNVRIRPNIDIYNLLNAAPPFVQNAIYLNFDPTGGGYRDVSEIGIGRFIKFGMQVDF